nr:GntR family transcriptional regulator [Granulosicoccus sp.]
MTTKATDSHTRAPLRSTYQRIVEEIRTGVLLPGDRLIETELAERLGTSRTPVREAIRQLEADALVVHLPRIGSTLRELDHAETSELYEMRAVLEGTAARFAARAASDVELAALAELHRNMTQTDDFDDLSRLNRQFHDALLDAARNRFLIRSTQSISK